MVSLYFWMEYIICRWGSRSETGLFKSRPDYSFGFYYQRSNERTCCIDRRCKALLRVGQIEPFPTNSTRRLYQANQANQHAALLHSAQVQSDSRGERGLLEVVNVSPSVQSDRIHPSLRNLEYDWTVFVGSKSRVWHASGRLWVRAIEICVDSQSVQWVQIGGNISDSAIQVCVLSDTQRDWKRMEWGVGWCGAFLASASLCAALSWWIRLRGFHFVEFRERGIACAWIRSVARSVCVVWLSVDEQAVRGRFGHEETERRSAFVAPGRGSQSRHAQCCEFSDGGLFGAAVPRGYANVEGGAREWSESLLVVCVCESDLQAAAGYGELCVQEDPGRFLSALPIEWDDSNDTNRWLSRWSYSFWFLLSQK